jgi:glycosyltransferase involved in cell wall biosynthesis
MSNPLVSFYIIAFNQSLFIEQAIRSACAQDYSPMEIIVSDDCSSDDTWEKIQSVATAYKGPHRIHTRRNPVNLGVSEHINSIWKDCKGDWIVASAGDDFSHPQRVSRIISVVAQNPKAKLVQSWLNEIDEAGNFLSLNKLNDNHTQADESLRKTTLHDRCSDKVLAYHGAAMAYAKDVVSSFPELYNSVIFEDNIVNVRAELLGDVFHVRTPLVSHRNHSGQLTRDSAEIARDILEARKKKAITSNVESLKQNIEDLSLAYNRKFVEKEVFDILISDFKRKLSNAMDQQRALYGIWPFTVYYLLRLKQSGARINKDTFLRAIFPKWAYRHFWYHVRRFRAASAAN